MAVETEGPRATRGGAGDAPLRWECGCREPPVLLATYHRDGPINIKVRDRYWHVFGEVRTVCPRCGTAQVLDLGAGAPEAPPVG